MPQLLVISASTRTVRIGPTITRWFADLAAQDGRFDVRVVDLAELALPFLDEPEHAAAHNYVHQHTRDWSAIVDAADAVVIVTPEYNRSFPAAVKNALDYLYDEWQDKPVGFVSYGMTSMGLRAVEALIPVVTALGMHPVAAAVCVPVRQCIDEAGRLRPSVAMPDAARGTLDGLHRLTSVLAASEEVLQEAR